MAGRLSFSIAVNLLTENFKKGANNVKDSLRSMQMQIVTFAAALGFAGFGLQGLVTRLINTARETSRVITALKNVSGSTGQFADNLRFLNDMSKRYGLEINALTGNYAKFAASANVSGMALDKQRFVFESLSRATTAFGMSADDTNSVFLALSQMMSKGKISSEELRLQMGEKLPIALQAMAKAAGTSVAGLDKLMKQGKLMSADILPKFAAALNEMLPDVDTDNLETSINRLSNMFTKFTDGVGVQAKYKVLVDGMTSILESATKNMQNIIVVLMAAIVFVVTNGASKILKNWDTTATQMVSGSREANAKLTLATASRVSAEKALEEARLKHSLAVGNRRVRAAERVARQEIIYARSVVAEDKARLVADQARAAGSVSVWTRSFNILRLGAAKFVTAIKSMWASFAPAIIITAITTLGYKIYEFATATSSAEKAMAKFNAETLTEGKNINNLFDAYKKANDGTKEKDRLLNLIKSKYGEYIKNLIDEKGRITDIDKAQRQANETMRQSIALRVKNAAIGEIQEDEVKKQASLLGNIRSRIAKDKGEDVANKAIEFIGAKINNDNISIGEAQKDITDYIKLVTGEEQYVSKYTGLAKNDLLDALNSVKKVRDETRNIENQFKGIIGDYTEPIATTPTTSPSDTDTDKAAERAAQKRLEALRKLDEADKQRQINKLAFDNEMSQNAIDLMIDGYDKRLAQLKLNAEKENQAIQEFEKKAAKEQLDYAKNTFVSKTGTEKGFEAFYAQADLSKLMPEGLKPADVKSQVDEMYAAARAANKKGLNDINKDIAISINQERLQFAGELDQRLSDSQAYFAERRRQVKTGSDEYFELLSLETRTIESIKTQHNTKVLQMENDYKEQAIALSSELFFFQADKDAALLKQKIENNKAYIESRKKELKTLSGVDYDTLDDTSIEKLMKEYPDLVGEIKIARLKQKEFNTELAKTPAQKLMEIVGLFNQISNTLSEITGIDFSALSSFGGIVASLADHDYLGAASSGLSLIGSFFTSINSSKSRQKEIQEQINKLQLEYNDSLRQQKFDIIESINYARIYKDNIETLNFLIAKGIVDAKDYSIWEAGNAEYLEAKKNVEDYRGEIENLDKGLFSYADRLWSGKITGDEALRMTKGKFDHKSSLDAIGRYKQGLIDSVQLAKELKAAGWQDGGIAEQIENATEKTEEWKEKLAEARSKLDEMSTGVSFDGFLGNAINALEEWARKGKNEISDLADFTEEALITAILSAYKYQILAEKLQPFYEELSDKMVNDPNSITADWAKDWGDRLTGQLEGDLNTLNYILENLGIDLTDKNDSTQSSSKGGFETMTQDQAGELSGRFTGLLDIGVKMHALMAPISMNTSNIFKQTISITDELSKQTEILDEIRQYQTKAHFMTESMVEMVEVIKNEAKSLGKIESNTKGLTSR